MLTFQGVILFILICALVYMVVEMLMPDHEKMMLERLQGMKLYSATEKERQMEKSLFTRVYNMAEKLFLRHMGEQITRGGSLAPLQIKLLQAGVQDDIEPMQHRAKRFIFSIGFTIIAMPTGEYKIIVAAVVIGFLYPDYKLKKTTEGRREKIKDDIADFLDLLAATYPGSKGFEDAIQRICERSSGIIPDEFQKMVDEINAGKRKKDALKALANRCGVNEIDMLVNQIIQSESLGTGLESTLRTQADKMRILKRTQAEIKARKAAITLLMPSVFLLVSILIVIAGPSIVQLLQVMSSM